MSRSRACAPCEKILLSIAKENSRYVSTIRTVNRLDETMSRSVMIRGLRVNTVNAGILNSFKTVKRLQNVI